MRALSNPPAQPRPSADVPKPTPVRTCPSPPTAPVVSEVEPCTSSGAAHKWSTRGSNGSNRRYTCKTCKVVYKEKEDAGRWHVVY